MPLSTVPTNKTESKETPEPKAATFCKPLSGEIPGISLVERSIRMRSPRSGSAFAHSGVKFSALSEEALTFAL